MGIMPVIRFEQHPTWAIRLPAPESSPFEFAQVFRSLFSGITKVLRDIKEGRLSYFLDGGLNHGPNGIPCNHAIVEAAFKRMQAAWERAGLPPEPSDVRPDITWIISKYARKESVKTIEEYLFGIRLWFIERLEFSHPSRVRDIEPVDFDPLFCWLEEFEQEVKIRMERKLWSAAAGKMERPICGTQGIKELKEAWANSMRPGRGMRKKVESERRRICYDLITLYRKDGEGLPTIRVAAELLGASPSTLSPYWAQARSFFPFKD